MPRWILRYAGASAPPAEHKETILKDSDVRVVDSSSRMLLVESDQPRLSALLKDLPGWTMSEERSYALPDPRPKLKTGG